MLYRDYMGVGIRDLKARLSSYVGQAARGDRITITDRGRPVAELVPLSTDQIERGIAAGWIEPARRSGFGPALLLSSDQSSAAVLDDDRGN